MASVLELRSSIPDYGTILLLKDSVELEDGRRVDHMALRVRHSYLHLVIASDLVSVFTAILQGWPGLDFIASGRFRHE